MEPLRSRFRIAIFRNVFDFATAVLGNLVEQKPVRCHAEAHREYARVRMFLDLGDDFHVITYLAIGHEASDAYVVTRI